MKQVNQGRIKNLSKDKSGLILDGIQFNTQLELNCYKTFRKYGIDVEYEPHTFTLIPSFEFQGVKIQPVRYTPDFLLSYKDIRVWIESKGMLLTQDWIRMKLFMRQCVTLDSNEPFYMLKSMKEAELISKWITGELKDLNVDDKDHKRLMNILQWKLKRTTKNKKS